MYSGVVLQKKRKSSTTNSAVPEVKSRLENGQDQHCFGPNNYLIIERVLMNAIRKKTLIITLNIDVLLELCSMCK